MFSSTLLPNIRPRPLPVIDLASSDLLPQIPPRSQPERASPRVPQPGVVNRRECRRRPDQNEFVVRNRAFDENQHDIVNVPGGTII